jgi:insulysin
MRLIPYLLLMGSACFGQIVDDTCEIKILTPSLKDRLCRKIRLNNGLEALLISDPGANQSGAALAVQTGSWDDPELRPGMAHFVEHMLFLGTEKYPEEEGYCRYLDEHGGCRNAYTQSDRTVYFFSINHNGFSEALDRFGHFFIDPLFNPSGVARESKAIHQEFCKDVPLDGWRVHYVKKTLAPSNHPFHRFCIGNQQTLAKISQDELKSWYKEHYGAQIMHLAVISPLPLDELESTVTAIFEQVPVNNFKPQNNLPSLSCSQNTGKLVAITPLQKLQSLEFSWSISDPGLETHSDKLIAHVLGHEAEGSLFYLLKQMGLADGLYAGSSCLGKNQKVFSLSVQLTDKGLKEYEKVIELTFETLAKYQSSGIPKSIFDEVNQTDLLNYQFQSRQDVASIASDYASAMIDEPLSSFPQKTILATSYDKDQISTLLQAFTPESCLFTLTAPPEKGHFKTDQKEEWMGVEFTVQTLPEKKLTHWAKAKAHPASSLPPQNPYLPKNISLVEDKRFVEPLKLESSRGLCFMASDADFQVPQVYWALNIKTPFVESGYTKSLVLADLFCHTVEQRLGHDAYLASLGGLNFSLSPTHQGLLITLQGYSDKACLLLSKILETLTSTCPTRAEFEQYKNLAQRVYSNGYTRSPMAEASEALWQVIYEKHSGHAIKEKALKQLTYEEMKKFSKNVCSSTFIEALLYGNISEPQGLQVWEKTQSYFKGPIFDKSLQTKPSVACFKDVHLLSLQSPLKGNAVILALDLGDFSFKRRAAMDILCKGLEEPFFSELRTKQQTAYYVRNWGEELQRHLYAFFAIQSSSHNTRDLLSRFELFLESHLRNLDTQTLCYDRFVAIKAALIERLSHPVDNLESMGKLLNRLAFEYGGDFKWLDKRIEALNELSYNDFLELSAEFLAGSQPKRVAICVDGQLDPGVGIHYQTQVSTEKLRQHMEYKKRSN